MTSKSTREENVQAVFDLKAGYTLGIADVEILKRVARMALAAMDSEPVYQYQSGVYNDDNGETDWYWDDCDKGFYEQYAHDRRRILYRHAQPAPVVPAEKTMPNPLSMYAVDAVAAIAEVKGWNACRATMLQAGTLTNEDTKQAWTGIPDIDNAINMLDRIDTLESCDDDRIEAVKTVLRRLAGNSPVIPDTWIPVSERMPEDRISVILWDAEIGEVTSGHYSHKTQTFYHCGDAIENEITHWMPPPCAPQEVK